METHAMSDSPSYPGMIMVIRHGEKPGASGDDKGGGPHLSLRGSARAAALPSLFIPGGTPAAGEQQLCCEIARVIRPRPLPGSCSQFLGTYTFGTVPAAASRFPTPQYLFATAPSSDSSRPLETITPVAQALLSLNDAAIDATINSSFGNKSDEMQTLVSTLLKTSATYAGKVILICWHHGTIPELVEDFGVPKEQLKGWDPFPSSVFDVVMQITWSGTQANLEVRHQKLLFEREIAVGWYVERDWINVGKGLASIEADETGRLVGEAITSSTTVNWIQKKTAVPGSTFTRWLATAAAMSHFLAAM